MERVYRLLYLVEINMIREEERLDDEQQASSTYSTMIGYYKDRNVSRKYFVLRMMYGGNLPDVSFGQNETPPYPHEIFGEIHANRAIDRKSRLRPKF
jgi:hypothetical protein